MNDKKLDDLIRKGLHDSTPDPEALACLRAAAKHFQERKPSSDELERVSKLEEERDAARAESAKHKAECDKLKLLLGKVLALQDAEQKLEKAKTDVQREAREALGQQKPAKPVDRTAYEWMRDAWSMPNYGPGSRW